MGIVSKQVWFLEPRGSIIVILRGSGAASTTFKPK